VAQAQGTRRTERQGGKDPSLLHERHFRVISNFNGYAFRAENANELRGYENQPVCVRIRTGRWELEFGQRV